MTKEELENVMVKPHWNTVRELLKKAGGNLVSRTTDTAIENGGENYVARETWYFPQGVLILQIYSYGDWHIFRNWPLVQTSDEITAILT